MVINSAGYLLFLMIISIAYYIFPSKYQNYILLIANAVFYLMCAPRFFLLIAVTTVASYLFGRLLSSVKRNRAFLFVLSLLFTLGPLFCYKYLKFFSDIVSTLFSYINLQIGGIEG